MSETGNSTHILMSRHGIEDADQVCLVSFTNTKAKDSGPNDAIRVLWTAATRSSNSNEEQVMTRTTARAVWKKLVEGGEFILALSVPGKD